MRSNASNIFAGSPESALGEMLFTPHGQYDDLDFLQPMRIVGVVENRPLKLAAIGATASFFMLMENLEFHIVRLSADDVPGALTAIDETWARLSPSMPRRAMT